MAARALASALRQRDVSLEAIVVSDGSPPPAGGVAGLDDPRVRLVQMERSSGVSSSRNRALALARGAWVAFLDDDDVWAPAKLARQLAVARASGADFVWTGSIVVNARLEAIGVTRAPAAEGLERSLRSVNSIGTPSSVIVRRDRVEAAGGFDEELSVLADWDLWIRMAASARGASCDELLTAYTIHRENMHVVHMRRAVEERRYMSRKHAALSGDRRAGLGDAAFWAWVASGYRRDGRALAAARAYVQVWRRTRSGRDLARAAGVLLGERAMRAAARPPVEADMSAHGWLAVAREQWAEASASG